MTDIKLTQKSLHLRFSPINPPSHEVLCRPGLVGPKIAFSVGETGASWSENFIFTYDEINTHLLVFFVH